jgi:hypothetical protein
MRVFLALFSLWFFVTPHPIESSPSYESLSPDTCKTGKDRLTGRVIYLSGDMGPEYFGGTAALVRRMSKEIKYPDSGWTVEMRTQYLVAFIVEPNGHISGERIIRGKNQIGQQLLKIARSLTWTPGQCNGKKVPMLYKLPMNIDFSETKN